MDILDILLSCKASHAVVMLSYVQPRGIIPRTLRTEIAGFFGSRKALSPKGLFEQVLTESQIG